MARASSDVEVIYQLAGCRFRSLGSILSTLDVAVYLYIAGYHLLDPRDTQYGHKVTCHFLIVPTGASILAV